MADRIVCKFGGSSVADHHQYAKIKNIITADSRRKIIVVSAPGKRTPNETKLTDLLYSTHDLALKSLDFRPPWNLIRERFLGIAQELNIQTSLEEDLNALESQLDNAPQEIPVDYLVSRGEFLSARLMADFLGGTFVDAYPLIQFDHRFRVLPESYQNIAEELNDDDKIYVIPGFYGSDLHQQVKTFTRGGSDITGAILASACNAVCYENWTDVSGLLIADPRIVPDAKPMASVSYPEIRELAYSGASVLHDEAIAPCRDKNIPINIRNTNRPQDEGTMIKPPNPNPSHTITGIAGRKGFAMIHIEKSMMNKEKGFGRRLMTILEEEGLSWEHVPTGIDSMSVVLEQKALQEVEESLMESIQQQLQPDGVKIYKDIALIATVGHGMNHKVGVAASLFAALSECQANVRIIDQGGSEINIIVGVEQKDYEKSIQAIYHAFVQ